MTGIVQALIAGLGTAVSAVTDAYFNLVTLLLPGNGTNGAHNNTFLDSSSNNFSITRNPTSGPNAPTQGTFSPFSQTGWGNYFDGSSSLSSTSTGLAVGTSTFTLEMWVYFPAATGNADLFDTRTSNTTDTAGFIFGVGSDNCLKYYAGTGSNVSFGTTIPTNQWVHIALTRNGSNTINAFLNGVLSGTSSTDSANKTNSRFSLFATAGNASYTTGYCSNARLVVGSVLYTATFTPPTSPLTAVTNTKLLTSQSNRFVDNSNTAAVLTISGTPSVQAFSPFAPTAAYSASTVGGSGYFDNTGDYLTVAANSAFDMGTGDFTWEGWAYIPSDNNGSAVISINNAELFFRSTANGQTVAFYNGSVIASSATTYNFSSWNHIAVTRSGTTLRVYLNGASGTSATHSSSVGGASSTLYIGSYTDGTSDTMFGYLTDVRIVKGTAVYTGASYTVPTAPLTAISGTSLLLSYTNAGITDATAKNDLETVGNAQISTTQSKWGGSSMYFDGDDNLSMLFSNQNFNFGSGNFTIEAWFYLTATTKTDQTLIADNTSSFSAGSVLFKLCRSGKVAVQAYDFNSGGTPIVQSSTTISANTWYYVALTRSGNTFQIYLNGSADGSSGSFSGNINFNANSGTLIGKNNLNGADSFITGYVDDLRITKGYARSITASPTAAFPLQ